MQPDCRNRSIVDRDRAKWNEGGRGGRKVGEQCPTEDRNAEYLHESQRTVTFTQLAFDAC